MKKQYQIVTRAAKESAAVVEQFCQTNGQILLPLVNLIESASQVVENVIHEIQIQTLETIHGSCCPVVLSALQEMSHSSAIGFSVAAVSTPPIGQHHLVLHSRSFFEAGCTNCQLNDVAAMPASKTTGGDPSPDLYSGIV